jgi:hypothetical protein
MKLIKHADEISKEIKAAFFDGFFTEFCKVPFGSMTKRDMECLLLKLLYDHALINSASNRQAANALGINETRLKGYLVDTRYKYRPDVLAENIEKIIGCLHDGKKLAVNLEKDGFLSFVLEDPVLRLDLAQALKDIGHYADTSFNSELVKVKNYALLALLLKHRGEDKALYKAIAEQAGENKNALSAYLRKQTTWLERGKGIFEYVKHNPLVIFEIAMGIAGLKK